MAKDKEEVIFEIDVRYTEAIEKIADYQEKLDSVKDTQKELTKSLKEGRISQVEYDKAMAVSKIQVQEFKESQRQLTKEIRNNIATEVQQEGSLKSLRAELSNTIKKFDELGRAQREGAEGKELLNTIDNLRSELTQAEEASGRFQRNVGNYKALNRDTIESLKIINPQLGDLADKLQNSDLYTKTMGKSTEYLSNTLKISAGSALGLQLALGALIAGGIYLVIKAYERWNKEAEKTREFNEQFTTELESTTKGIGRQIITVKELQKEWMKLGNSLSDKEKFIKANKKRFEELGVSINNTKDAEILLISNTENFIKSLKLKAKAAAAYELASKAYEKQLKKEYEAEKEMTSDPTFGDKWNAQVSQFNAGFNKLLKPLGAIQTSWDVAEGFRSGRADALREEAKEAEKTGDAYFNMATSFSSAQKKIEDGLGIFKVKNDKNNPKSSPEADKLAKLKLESEIKSQKDILSSEEASYKERETALTKYLTLQETLIEIDKKSQLSKKGITEKEKTVIEATANNQRLNLYDEYRSLWFKSYTDEQNRLAEVRKTNIENELSTVKEGSERELKLRLEQLSIERQNEIDNAEKTCADVNLINEKYRQLEIKEREKFNDQIDAQRAKEWQNEVMQAELRGENTLPMLIEQKVAEISALRQLDGEGDADFLNRKLTLQTDLKNLEDKSLNEQLQTRTQMLDATASIAKGFEDLFSSLAEDNEELAVFSKAMALFQIGLDTAQALTTGIAQAQKVGPPPFSTIATMTTIASVLANVAKAKKYLSSESQPKAPKFATGGLVSGSGSGTSDSINARLSNGESVMTALATSMFSPMLSAFNQIGGGVPITPTTSVNVSIGEDMLARAFAKGALMLPSPSVSVQEINNVGNRVNVLENSSVL